ncbi:hypothetical protein BDA96_04G150100 [Sorghum bicolor]|uniref:Uncharacterized protein n=2 Tax=Sorghum bicolor TaxID=4558 RepID=A0A921R5I7_SORBI|nr:hypothetical protein BDA96_04G150100 [Sorghum bicolor]KXG30168.1 hypothetical protein SORBI_3004G140800 [Sorghum bicolor]
MDLDTLVIPGIFKVALMVLTAEISMKTTLICNELMKVATYNKLLLGRLSFYSYIM